MRRLLSIFVSSGIGLMLPLGCAKDSSQAKMKYAPTASTQPPSAHVATQVSLTHDLTRDEAYYKIGPQQAQPPDGTMRKGTKVGIVREVGSYSEVIAEDGTRGYVPTDSLRSTGNKLQH